MTQRTSAGENHALAKRFIKRQQVLRQRGLQARLQRSKALPPFERGTVATHKRRGFEVDEIRWPSQHLILFQRLRLRLVEIHQGTSNHGRSFIVFVKPDPAMVQGEEIAIVAHDRIWNALVSPPARQRNQGQTLRSRLKGDAYLRPSSRHRRWHLATRAKAQNLPLCSSVVSVEKRHPATMQI
jgi:hypothetical protein